MDLRTIIFQRKLKTEDIATPFWSQKDEQGNELVDGFIQLQDIPADELTPMQIALKSTPALLMPAIAVRCLIDKRTGERIFTDTDRDALAARGSSELLPVFERIQEFLGMNNSQIVAEIKKNLGPSLNGFGGTPSLQDARLVP